MADRLRAVVIGAGFAGQGHTAAMRAAGVEVVALCARTPEVVAAVAGRLGIPSASTDWYATLRAVRPDIVCIGTPASLRREVIEAGAAQGAHLFCDKPLAATATEARDLARIAAQAGVKHAYAATHHYDPSVRWLAAQVQDGAIGALREIEGTFRRHLDPLTPFTWYDTLATGGGLLHNAFPHWLAILTTIAGGRLARAMGESRVLRHSAPVVPDLHDFRERARHTPSAADAARLEWRGCDADNAFSALLRVRRDGDAAAGGGVTTESERTGLGEVQASLIVSGAPATWPANGWRLHGDQGTLLADGHYSYRIARQRRPDGEREALPVPQRYLDALPQVGTEFENKWAALARDFVADVQGATHAPYLTFDDGARFQQAMEAIREGRGWQTVG